MKFDLPNPAAVAPQVNPKAGDFLELPPLTGSKFESSRQRTPLRLNIPSPSGKRGKPLLPGFRGRIV